MNEALHAPGGIHTSLARGGHGSAIAQSTEQAPFGSKAVFGVAGAKGLVLLAAIFVLTSPIARAAEQPVNHSDTLQTQSDKPINVIFDTDMWSDIDDMLALAMLNTLQDRHEVNLVAVTVSTEDPWSAAYIDAVDAFYGHPQIPVGLVHNGVNGEATRRKAEQGNSGFTLQKVPYVQWIAERRNPDGSAAFPHRLIDGSKVPEATALLRKILAAQADGSVVMVQVGFSTNLARLLDTPPDKNSPLSGAALVKKKVRLLSVMAGNFSDTEVEGTKYPKGQPEFNLLMDVPSAQRLFDNWPTPIVVSGFEIGLAMLFPAKSIESDFSYVQDHPIAETYRYFAVGDTKWPHDHATFDLTSVLYAARPDRNYFSLSKPGKITVLPDGGSRFEETQGGTHRYLILEDNQRARVLESMVMLASQPPTRCGH